MWWPISKGYQPRCKHTGVNSQRKGGWLKLTRSGRHHKDITLWAAPVFSCTVIMSAVTLRASCVTVWVLTGIRSIGLMHLGLRITVDFSSFNVKSCCFSSGNKNGHITEVGQKHGDEPWQESKQTEQQDVPRSALRWHDDWCQWLTLIPPAHNWLVKLSCNNTGR